MKLRRLNPDQPEAAKVEAGKLFFRWLDTLIERREDFIIESTLAGRGIGRILARLSRTGYRTHLAFVFLDTPQKLFGKQVGGRARADFGAAEHAWRGA